MEITYEMVFNAHVRQLTVSLKGARDLHLEYLSRIRKIRPYSYIIFHVYFESGVLEFLRIFRYTRLAPVHVQANIWKNTRIIRIHVWIRHTTKEACIAQVTPIRARIQTAQCKVLHANKSSCAFV